MAKIGQSLRCLDYFLSQVDTKSQNNAGMPIMISGCHKVGQCADGVRDAEQNL